MNAIVFHGTRDVRCEAVPDPRIEAPTDAIVRITHTAICGSDLWFYRGETPYEPGWRTGHEPMGVVDVMRLFFHNLTLRGGPAPVRAYMPELMADVLAGTLDPSPVFDMRVDLAGVPAGYAAMDERRALKVLVRV